MYPILIPPVDQPLDADVKTLAEMFGGAFKHALEVDDPKLLDEALAAMSVIIDRARLKIIIARANALD